MSIWVAIAALIFVAVFAIASRVQTHRNTVRRASNVRPEYHCGNHAALAEWRAACNKSLTWSRKRRNKEVT